jgi:hypothetical protein
MHPPAAGALPRGRRGAGAADPARVSCPEVPARRPRLPRERWPGPPPTPPRTPLRPAQRGSPGDPRPRAAAPGGARGRPGTPAVRLRPPTGALRARDRPVRPGRLALRPTAVTREARCRSRASHASHRPRVLPPCSCSPWPSRAPSCCWDSLLGHELPDDVTALALCRTRALCSHGQSGERVQLGVIARARGDQAGPRPAAGAGGRGAGEGRAAAGAPPAAGAGDGAAAGRAGTGSGCRSPPAAVRCGFGVQGSG